MFYELALCLLLSFDVLALKNNESLHQTQHINIKGFMLDGLIIVKSQVVLYACVQFVDSAIECFNSLFILMLFSHIDYKC
jgi:hypothetical protein